MYNDHLIPEVYKTRRLHSDWSIWPFTLIPRKWTFVGLPMPAFKIAGNAEPIWTPIQPGYPLAPMAQIEDRVYFNGITTKIIPHVLSMHPVHPAGQWSIQGVYVPALKRIVPCYASGSYLLAGKRLHTNLLLKPDITLGDFGWWIEGSLTWTRPK